MVRTAYKTKTSLNLLPLDREIAALVPLNERVKKPKGEGTFQGSKKSKGEDTFQGGEVKK